MNYDPDYEIVLYQMTPGRWVAYANPGRYGVVRDPGEVFDSPESAVSAALALIQLTSVE